MGKLEKKECKCVIVIFRDMIAHIGEIFSFVKRVKNVTLLEYGEILEHIQTSHLGPLMIILLKK